MVVAWLVGWWPCPVGGWSSARNGGGAHGPRPQACRTGRRDVRRYRGAVPPGSVGARDGGRRPLIGSVGAAGLSIGWDRALAVAGRRPILARDPPVRRRPQAVIDPGCPPPSDGWTSCLPPSPSPPDGLVRRRRRGAAAPRRHPSDLVDVTGRRDLAAAGPGPDSPPGRIRSLRAPCGRARVAGGASASFAPSVPGPLGRCQLWFDAWSGVGVRRGRSRPPLRRHSGAYRGLRRIGIGPSPGLCLPLLGCRGCEGHT